MGTKRNPGEFDCYANAAPDEPMFILLGRDPIAADLVDRWWALRQERLEAEGRLTAEEVHQISEARSCAAAMRAYAAGYAAGKAKGSARPANHDRMLTEVRMLPRLPLGRQELIEISGPPGCGKTQRAREIAAKRKSMRQTVEIVEGMPSRAAALGQRRRSRANVLIVTRTT